MNRVERDIQAAEFLGQAGFQDNACFLCQQAVEKGLKALLIKKTGDFPKIHSLRDLAVKAEVFSELKDLIADLDTDYAATRYFTAMEPGAEAGYTKKKFEKRFADAKRCLELIRKWMKD